MIAFGITKLSEKAFLVGLGFRNSRKFEKKEGKTGRRRGSGRKEGGKGWLVGCLGHCLKRASSFSVSSLGIGEKKDEKKLE